MLSDNFEIFHYKDSYLKDVDLHHHDFYEVYFFISGDVSYTIESKTYALKPGDILLISPKELHQPVISQNKTYERIVLWINCSYLERISTQKSDLTRCFNAEVDKQTNLLRLNEHDQKSIKSSMLSLLSTSKNEAEYNDILSRAMLLKLMAELNFLFLDKTVAYENESNLSDVMKDIVKYINDKHTERISLDLLSQKFFISKYHMSREFMRHFGITIHRYVVKKRLITAKQYLAEGLAPSNVYAKCGFSDYSNFYRSFRSEYGISPKEYADYSKELEKRFF